MIPNLKFLDDEEITPDERAMANTGSFFERNMRIKKKMSVPPVMIHSGAVMLEIILLNMG
jgi:hypothetical protein